MNPALRRLWIVVVTFLGIQLLAGPLLGPLSGGGIAGAQEGTQEPPGGEEVGAGYDLFTTDASETDLLGIPFAGNAGIRPTYDFEPPPDSADGRRAIADTDTIVHRLEDAWVASVPGTADPIAIELVQLRLVSAIGFDVDLGGVPPEDRRLFVTLQKDRNPVGETRYDFDVPPPADPMAPPPAGPIEESVLPGPRSFGEMTIRFGSAAGGTFDSRLDVYADLRYGAPDGPIVCGETIGLPPCSDLDAGLVLESMDSPWGRDPAPESIAIRGVNFSLASPDRKDPVDTSRDFWAGVDPFMAETVCLRHAGHPGPTALSTVHNICRTTCTTDPIGLASCRNGRDDDCNGTIDDCDEDRFGPVVAAPAGRVFECGQDDPDLSTAAVGFATATDNCFPPTLPPANIRFDDFETRGCGRTFLVDRVWSATDDCGNEASMPDLQQLRVVDTTPPDVACPQPRTILWTGDRGPAALGFATGADACSEGMQVEIDFSDVSVAGVCRSEEVTRTWTATDPCGLETPCTQPISIRGPKDAIEDLAALLPPLLLPDGIDNALTSTLQNGVANVCGNRSIPAANQLRAFINQVEAQTPQRIRPADAARLIAAAEAIIAAIEDPAGGGACPEGCGEDGGDGGDGDGGDGGDGDGGDGGDETDTDGDGIADEDDACPASDTSPTVVIDGCDSGVPNVLLADGCTVSDRIARCAAEATNHGGFVRCVVDLEDELVAGSFITRRQRAAIQRCAARADLP